MARRSTKTTSKAPHVEGQAAPVLNGDPDKPARVDTAALDVEALAGIILARQIKPRAGEIRRLAEEVLRQKAKKAAKKARKAEGKGERKLSRIPARKGRK